MQSINDWITRATRGERFEYARMGRTRDTLGVAPFRAERAEARKSGRQVSAACERTCEEAAAAWALYERGLVTLVQHREDSGDLAYLAVKI